MTVTEAALQPEPPAPRRRFGDNLRTVLRGIGQTMITIGCVLLLYVVYQVWVTNLFSERLQHNVHNALEEAWADGRDPLALPGGAQRRIPIGTGIANLYIPRFGADYAFTIVEGTNDASLEKGPGHYPATALPGEVGNFAVAGHRVGKGEPFLNLDKLRVGDDLVIETKGTWFVYKVLGKDANLAAPNAEGVPGRRIVMPHQGEVAWPVPSRDDVKPTQKYMTFTTCHPKYTADQRMVIHSVLARHVKQDGAKLPRELAGGTL